MERTPPRRSARLMNTGSISSSIFAISTNSTMVSTSGSITTTATTRLDDGAPSIIAVRNVVAADTAQVSRQSTEDKPTSHNIDDIEKRLAMLEATLKSTQVQVRERDVQNELLRAALIASSNSTVTYTSSAVTQSQSTQPVQLAPLQSVPTHFETLSASVRSSTATPFFEAAQPPQLASTNFCTTPRPVISAGMTDSFRTVTTQQTNDTLCAPLPITQANGRNYKIMSGKRRRSNIGRSTVNTRRVRSARDEESSTEREDRSQARYRYRAERKRESSVERAIRRSRDRDRQRDRESSLERRARLSQLRDRYRAERKRESSVEREVLRS
ncbi:unnamed protein product [Ceratitis capitata]|uniref:(Mediterranean fruit fly) hypothetical protein n=1 Tax=Ceratitis capitata TaxID=7213 RepID=A0A811UWD6_CERCA|nr:unnamed protein product [Ceratitis capitata]